MSPCPIKISLARLYLKIYRYSQSLLIFNSWTFYFFDQQFKCGDSKSWSTSKLNATNQWFRVKFQKWYIWAHSAVTNLSIRCSFDVRNEFSCSNNVIFPILHKLFSDVNFTIPLTPQPYYKSMFYSRGSIIKQSFYMMQFIQKYGKNFTITVGDKSISYPSVSCKKPKTSKYNWF